MAETNQEVGGEGQTAPEPDVVVSSEAQQAGGILGGVRKAFGLGESTPKPQILVQAGRGQPVRVEQVEPAQSEASQEKQAWARSLWQKKADGGVLTPEQELLVAKGIPPVEGGAEGPGQPEQENPEFRDPKYRARRIATALVEIDTMEAEQREANVEVNGQYCEQLTVYANADQALQQNAAITEIERGLEVFDQNYIDSDPNRTPTEKEALGQLLNNLDAAEAEHKRYEETLKLKDEVPSLFSNKGWKEQQDRLNQLQNRITSIEQEIADADFLARRRAEQVEVQAEITRLEEGIRQIQQQEEREIFSEPSEWEKNLEEQDRQIRSEDLPADLPLFSEVSTVLQEQERLRKANDASFNEDIYRQSKEIVGWYFQEAGRLGMLFVLDQELDFEFPQYMKDLGLQPAKDPYGREQYAQRMILNQARDLIRTNIESRLNENSRQYVESQNAWEDLEETGRFTPAQREQFRGVGAEYMRRAYEQMRVSLTNLVHLKERLKLQTNLIRGRIEEADYDGKLARIPRDIVQINRVYGEWNFGIEAKLRHEMESRALAEQSRPLFRETYFQIELEGENSREVELAAEQAAEHITSSTGSYSLDAVRQRRDLLIRAIEDKREVLARETGGVKDKTDALVERIKRVALNKLDFFILHWLAQNLRMDEYGDYFEQTVMQDGTSRLKVIPSMSDGLEGLAILYLLTPEYRLFFQPGGFRNQLNESDAQSYLRELRQDQLVDTLMGFELKGENWAGKTKTLQDLMSIQSTDQFLKYFQEHKKTDADSQHPAARLERARQKYQQVLKDAQASSTDPEALVRLRETRDLLAFEQNRYQTAKNRVKNAVTEAIRVMDITGESARLASPTIIMDNGDHISVEDAALFYKFAIFEAARAYGRQYGAEDNQSLIRWRSGMWIDRWEKAGLDRSKASREFKAGGKEENYNKLPVTLKEGWEETGLTEGEWKEFEDAAALLRKDGYKAKLKVQVRQKDGSYKQEELTFAEIIKKPELQPVLSNFLADYKSSNNQLNDRYIRRQAARGRLESVKNILTRLGLKKPIEGNAQTVLNKYTELIEASRQLDAELTRLTYYEATHASLDKVKTTRDGRTIYQDSAFSADRVEYGYQGKPWGIGRAQHRKAFVYTNYRRTAPRAIDLVHAIPFTLTSLAKESASDDILSFFWDLNRLEKDDNWTLMTFAMRNKDAWFVGSKMDGGDMDLARGEWKQWTFLEKPLTDANSLLGIFDVVHIGDLETLAQRINEKATELTLEQKEKIEKHFREVTLSRFKPIIEGTEKQLTNDRQALGSGAGFEENEKFALRFLEYIMSEKHPSEEHAGREQGGWESYEEIQPILRVIVAPDSYIPGSSIWDEVWRKITPGHNPRIPSRAPEPTYLSMAA